MAKELLSSLQKLDLRAASFLLAQRLSGRVLKSELVYALDVFNALPCPETAVHLLSCEPSLAPLLLHSEVLRSQFVTQDQQRVARFHALHWIQAASFADGISKAIYEFLLKQAQEREIKIGFHLMRDQRVLVERLREVGLSRPWFGDTRQFLRDTICPDESAYRSVIDLVCVWGIQNGREQFWDGLGASVDGSYHDHAEILFSLESKVNEFSQLVEVHSVLKPDSFVSLPGRSLD